MSCLLRLFCQKCSTEILGQHQPTRAEQRCNRQIVWLCTAAVSPRLMGKFHVVHAPAGLLSSPTQV